MSWFYHQNLACMFGLQKLWWNLRRGHFHRPCLPQTSSYCSRHTGTVRDSNRVSRVAVTCTYDANGSRPQEGVVASWPPLPDSQTGVAFIPPPPPLTLDIPAWTDEVGASPLDPGRRIFCNRSLNMQSIKAVGFDMDYTLAQYKPEAFETLAYKNTIKKLVTVFGYPQVLYKFEFDWRYMMRGLTIDKRNGNILKIDRHKYVKLAYHGFRPLAKDERVSIYNNGASRLSFEEPEFALIDTLFSLAEAYLFMQLVELRDAGSHQLPPGKAYVDLYRDVRAAVDLCHRDGSLKRAVAEDPGAYIHEDPRIVSTLEMLRESGKKLFLATNSLWDYTNVVMNFLIDGATGQKKSTSWLRYFDVVITGCGKPAFFSQMKPLFEVHTATGMLYNTEGGSPMVPIGEEDLPALELGSSAPADLSHSQDGKARVFQGGNYVDLHKMLRVTSGSQVLYIGDHIYGDILRSKKTLGWRTMLVVPELEAELTILSNCKGSMQELLALRYQRDALDDQMHRLEWALESSSRHEIEQEDLDEYQEAVENLRGHRDEVKEKHRRLLHQHHRSFHCIWGQLLKTGYQNSQFAHQMERFACLYTSHVSNLSFYSPFKCYRGRLDMMAHEEAPWFDTQHGD